MGFTNKFLDQFDINFDISQCGPQNLSTTVMRKQEGNLQKSPMNVPLVAKDYSENGMQHVDTFNTAMKNQWAKYKNFTWRRAHLLTMFKISFVNSWIIYKKIHNQNIKQGDFLILL